MISTKSIILVEYSLRTLTRPDTLIEIEQTPAAVLSWARIVAACFIPANSSPERRWEEESDLMNAFISYLAKLALAGSIALGVASAAHAEDKTVRIGYQKYGTLILLKTQ